jgi:hypothetical protein
MLIVPIRNNAGSAQSILLEPFGRTVSLDQGDVAEVRVLPGSMGVERDWHLSLECIDGEVFLVVHSEGADVEIWVNHRRRA